MNPCQSIARRLVLSILLLGVVFTTGCANDAAVISQSATAHKELEPAVMTDPELAGYLQEVGERIVKAGKDMAAQGKAPKHHNDENSDWMYSGNMKFHLVNSTTLNAFTTGGEHMYIYNALLQTCRTEDELAAVVAHEYAHVYCRHIHQAMNRQKGQLAIMGVGGVLGAVAAGKEKRTEGALMGVAAAGALGQFAGMKFTRDDEAQADEYGMAFYWRAGWDPKRFGDFFQQMVDLGHDTQSEWLSDHPTLRSRVEAANKRAIALAGKTESYRRPPVADKARFAQIKARAATLGRTLPQDKSLEMAQKVLSSFSSCVTPVDQPDQVEARKELIGRR